MVCSVSEIVPAPKGTFWKEMGHTGRMNLIMIKLSNLFLYRATRYNIQEMQIGPFQPEVSGLFPMFVI